MGYLYNGMDVYQENGYKDRADYLEQLSMEYDCPIEIINSLVDSLGKSEDFDGLVSALRDWEEMRGC